MNNELAKSLDAAAWEALQKSHHDLSAVVRQLVEAEQTPTQIAARVKSRGLVGNIIFMAASHLARQGRW